MGSHRAAEAGRGLCGLLQPPCSEAQLGQLDQGRIEWGLDISECGDTPSLLLGSTSLTVTVVPSC